MPKETVQDERYGKDNEYRELQVRWNRNGWVELATVDVDPALGDPKPESGIYMSVDRAGLNKLIRNLQRAGKQAFGEDAW